MPRRSPCDSPTRRRSSLDSPRRRRSYSPPRRSRSEATSLLVRNISRDTRPEDLKGPFERYGVVKDVYLPKDYYTGEPRGFGFVQFMDPQDAIEAQYKMNHQVIKGREVSVVFAEETRKKPSEMRMREAMRDKPTSRRSPRRGRSRSRSPRYRSRSPPHRYRSRSPPSHRTSSRSPRRRYYSRSPERRGREKVFYPSPGRSRGSSSAYQRDHFPSHSRGDIIAGYPPFVAAMPRFDMFGQMHPPYPPPYHPGPNRLWGDV